MFDKSIKLADNAMLKHRPELFDEWDFEKNNELGLDIYKTTRGSDKKAWWICLKCDSSYDSLVYSRVRNQGNKCPYCTNRKANHTNSLALLFPGLAQEWHPTKNGNLTPHDVTQGSGKIVWWNCPKCGSSYDMSPKRRTYDLVNCPYCSGHRKNETNCLWATHPEVARLLIDSQKGYKITSGMESLENFKCNDCGTTVSKRINNVVNQGLSCPKCSDGMKYPEKFMFNLLKQLNIDFENQKVFKWANNKRYDFYIPILNYIIETHGKQHYGEGFERLGGRSLSEEKENDRIKEKLANKNGVSEYIVIDCRISDPEYIKNNTIKSKIAYLFDLSDIDWLQCHEFACKTFVKVVCDLWNTGKTTSKISKLTKLSVSTVIKYLKQGQQLNWCNYNSKQNHLATLKRNHKRIQKTVVQLSKDAEYIKEWKSITDASNSLDIRVTSICDALRGRTRTAGNFRWMYLSDYNKNKNNLKPYEPKKRNRAIVKIDSEKEVVLNKYESITEAYKDTGIHTGSITCVCKGKRKTAGGYKWMYKEDYDKLIQCETT